MEKLRISCDPPKFSSQERVEKEVSDKAGIGMWDLNWRWICGFDPCDLMMFGMMRCSKLLLQLVTAGKCVTHKDKSFVII